MKDEFGAARIVLGIATLLGWIVIVAGVAGGVMAMGTRDPAAGMLMGAALAISGMITVALAQLARAGVVTAENSHKTVEILSRMEAAGFGPAPGVAAPQDAGRPSAAQRIAAEQAGGGVANVALAKVYKDHAIYRRGDGRYEVDGEVFKGIMAAERYIDGLV